MHFPAQKILADTIHRRLLANNPRNFFLKNPGSLSTPPLAEAVQMMRTASSCNFTPIMIFAAYFLSEKHSCEPNRLAIPVPATAFPEYRIQPAGT